MINKRLISLTICWILVTVPGLCVLSFADDESATIAEAEQHFEKANEFHKLDSYDAAITEYKAVISLSPKSAIAQNAQYWIGQIYYETRQFDDALSTFQELVDEFPSSVVVPTTKVMIERVQQAEKNKSLFEAVKKADVEQVKLLIAEGADVDAKWRDVYNKDTTKWRMERTPLWHAVDVCNLEMVKLLVEADADVNAGSWPPLCQAVDYENTAIAEYLIDHGANVNYPKDWGPLQEAATFSLKMVKLLLARGADVNGGRQPTIHAGIRSGHKDIVELLIQHGADINAKDEWGRDYTPLQRAAIRGIPELVKLLLVAGADISIKNDSGQTALHVSLDIRNSDYPQYRQSKDAVELLLARGADVNLKDQNGRTPLHLAVESADSDIVKLLLDKGARINEKDDESGFTALHYAVRLGNKSAAEMLIAGGTDINSKDKQGHTPLYVAVNHDYKIAEFLISKGADSTIRTESGRTLLQLAQQRKKMESTIPDLIFDGIPKSWFGLDIVCGDVDGDEYDDILIGAVYYDNKRGRVYLFYGGPDMDTTADLIFEGQYEGDHFGAGIACGDINNDGYEDIIIGACAYSKEQGRAYLYWGSERNSMDAKPDKVFDGENAEGSRFGMNSAVYDIDNDSYDDIILGAYWYPGDGTGRAYLYYGSTKELMDTSYDLIFTAENSGERFGYTISCGDVDNDGYGDIAFGSYDKQRGRAYLYFGGSKSNMDAKVDVIFEAQSLRYKWGHGLICVDQNRDGYDDVLIGAPGYNDKQGRAYLFRGSSKRSMDTDPDMIFDGEVEGSLYGVREVCGDIDGDSMNDLVIGAIGSGRGRVYVYWGNEPASPDPKPGRILTGENLHDEFGLGLACGDVNNDGFDDLVIGAFGYKAGADQGRAYLYYGGPQNK